MESVVEAVGECTQSPSIYVHQSAFYIQPGPGSSSGSLHY